jgi:flagellar biosynthesis chaperone FliJ
MSTGAHRVVKIETVGESFNLWHDNKITHWLGKKTDFFQRLNSDGAGLTCLDVSNLKNLLNELGKRIDKQTQKAIREDIEFAKTIGQDYVQYYCY